MKEEASMEAKQLCLSFFPLGHHTENHGLNITHKCACSVDLEAAAHPPWPVVGAECAHLVCGLYRVDPEAAAHPPWPAVGAECVLTSLLFSGGQAVPSMTTLEIWGSLPVLSESST